MLRIPSERKHFKMLKKSLSELTVFELKRHLVTAGLTVTGRKGDLVKRLLDAGHVGEGNIPEL